jgi:hypothetical protein
MSVKESWPHFGLAKTLNVAAHCAVMNNIPAGQRVYGLVVDVSETLYGSPQGSGL